MMGEIDADVDDDVDKDNDGDGVVMLVVCCNRLCFSSSFTNDNSVSTGLRDRDDLLRDDGVDAREEDEHWELSGAWDPYCSSF